MELKWQGRRVCAEMSLICAMAAIATIAIGTRSQVLPECLILGGLVFAPLAVVLGWLGWNVARGDHEAVWTAKIGFLLGVLLLSVCCLIPVGGSRDAAMRAQFHSNLKQVGLALANYESTYGTLPPAVVSDPQGRPLYSWRVLILPFLEADDVARAFHKDEPWDSPHNASLLMSMPRVYAYPGEESALQGKTFLEVISGPGTAFEGSGRLSALRLDDHDFPDGTDQTILVVEARKAVPWTSPTAIEFRPGKPIPALGSGLSESRPLFRSRGNPSEFHALFGDLSVHRLKLDTSEHVSGAWVTRKGGEPRVDLSSR